MSIQEQTSANCCSSKSKGNRASNTKEIYLMMAENNQGFEFGCDVKGEAKTLPQFRCQQEEFYQSSEPVVILQETRSEQKHSWDLMRFLVACYNKSLTPYEREFK
uniref:Uncharacterized protein n=1 Tax=Glossina palpalis gambiensis TaxID=67801 RepID=A0A1B0BWD1_9MUSC